MKKYLFPLIAGLGLAVSTRAAVILNESFIYADGPLTNVSAGKWILHSAFSQFIGPNVAGEKAALSQANQPDVNALLTGGPYASGNLYASFIVNFSGLPSGSIGDYFAHFKDSSTGFRCRVFASTNGTDGTRFRVGITKGQTGTAMPVYIPTELSLNTDYQLVIRYDTATTASTLWLNPGSEGAIGTTATDTVAAAAIVSFGLRQSLSGGNGMGNLTLDDLKVGTAFADVVVGGDPTLNPPFISNIPSQSIPRNGVTPSIPFYVIDGETAHGSLTLSAVSLNPTLVPVNNVVFGPINPSDSNRTVTITPAAGEQGVGQVNVTVTDSHNNIASRSFLVIVGAPTISTFTNMSIPKDTATPAIAITVGDAEGDTITLSAASTNAAVMPVGGIAFGGSGANRTVTITPAAGAAGLSRITIIATDGFSSVSNSFVLTVYPSFKMVLCDGFDYADGSLTNVSSIWRTHSGSATDPGDVKVIGGRILLSGTNSQDVSTTFTNPPSFFDVSFFPHEGWILYSRFTVNFLSRPTAAAGEYFAHFRNSGGSFGAKIFGTTNGAAAGKLRLGVSNSANAPANVVIATDLDVGTTYTVVSRYNVGTGQTRLWINPNSENDPGVTATDGAFPFTAETYSFRESAGMGNIFIDDVKVSTSFADVVQSRPVLTIVPSGSDVIISWTGGGTLQYTDALSSPPASIFWENVTGQTSPYTVSAGAAAARFYRVTVP